MCPWALYCAVSVLQQKTILSKEITMNASNTSQKTVTTNVTSSVLVWPANKKRSYLSIQNQSTLDILINVGAVPSATNSLRIPPGEEWVPVNPPKGDIIVIGTVPSGRFQTFFTIQESL